MSPSSAPRRYTRQDFDFALPEELLSEVTVLHNVLRRSSYLALLDEQPGALARLAAYPYGCSEQLSSRILPQLYAAALMPEGVPAPAPAGDPAVATLPVDKAIAQILTRQTSDGSFGLWSAEGGDRWLNAYVTDVLSRARAAGRAGPVRAPAARPRSAGPASRP